MLIMNICDFRKVSLIKSTACLSAKNDVESATLREREFVRDRRFACDSLIIHARNLPFGVTDSESA